MHELTAIAGGHCFGLRSGGWARRSARTARTCCGPLTGRGSSRSPARPAASADTRPTWLCLMRASWIADETFAAARPLTAATNGRMVIQSTPGEPVRAFYKMVREPPEAWPSDGPRLSMCRSSAPSSSSASGTRCWSPTSSARSTWPSSGPASVACSARRTSSRGSRRPDEEPPCRERARLGRGRHHAGAIGRWRRDDHRNPSASG